MNDTFLITVRSQPKHGALYAAYKQYGTIERLAEAMGCSATSVVNWTNLRNYPRSIFANGHHARRERIESGLQKVLGISAAECWPPEVREFIDRTRKLKSLVFEQTKEVPLQRLTAAATKQLAYEGDQETHANITECREAIEKVLKTLSYREREIIKLRYGLGSDGMSFTLEEVAHMFKVTRETIRHIEGKALRKLQKPHRSAQLSGFLD